MKNIPYYLIPGTMCDERLWHKMLPYMEPHQTIFGSYASETSMDDMLSAIENNKPDTSNLVGFSLGGYLAMAAAFKNPDAFENIIIIASSPYGLTEEEKKLRQTNAEMLGRMTYRGMSKKRLAQFVHSENLNDPTITETILQMEKYLGQDVLVNQLIAPINRRNLKTDLINFPKPIHFIMAEEDELVPIGAIEKFTEANPHITLHSIENTGHMIPLETPEELTNIINSIIT